MVPFTCIDRDHFRQHLEWPTPGQMAAGLTEPISLSSGRPPAAWLIAACQKCPKVPTHRRMVGRTGC